MVNEVCEPLPNYRESREGSVGEAIVSSENLYPALHIALVWQPRATRPALKAVLAFDARLGRLLGQAREPMLAQVRLAWWRDRLREPLAERSMGDPVLAALGETLHGRESELIALVDGWEELLREAPLGQTSIAAFAEGRARALGSIARVANLGDGAAESAIRAGRRWALADFTFRTSDGEEREAALSLVRAIGPCGPLPRELRGIAVLDALARRAVARREPIMSGRIAPLIALRVGITGR